MQKRLIIVLSLLFCLPRDSWASGDLRYYLERPELGRASYTSCIGREEATKFGVALQIRMTQLGEDFVTASDYLLEKRLYRCYLTSAKAAFLIFRTSDDIIDISEILGHNKNKIQFPVYMVNSVVVSAETGKRYSQDDFQGRKLYTLMSDDIVIDKNKNK